MKIILPDGEMKEKNIDKIMIKELFMSHRLRQESQCGSNLDSKSDEIGLIKKGTASPS